MKPLSFRRRDGSGSSRAPQPGRQECEKGVNEIEGYLLWQAEAAQARHRAEAFADRLPWLTCGQREEVVREYEADRLETSRAVLRRIADRALELRAEYSARYELLRLRLLGLFMAALAGCAGLALVLARVG